MPPAAPLDPSKIAELAKAIFANVRAVIHAPDEVLLYSIICLLAEGHVMIEDLPGTGKTTLAKALAISTSLTTTRIQFTPDLTAQDVVGGRSYEGGKYELVPGPIFTNIVVADELNRAAPRTQAIMLECMEERQVTLGAVSYEIKRPFLVLATQNPVEHEGTYLLPEAQMDRFMMRLSLGYPPKESEKAMLLEQAGPNPLDSLRHVALSSEVEDAIDAVRLVTVSEPALDYAVALLGATREDEQISIGASPRAGVSLMRAAKAYALVAGRDEVEVGDVHLLAPVVLAHRLFLKDGGSATIELAREILGRVAVPPS